MQTVATVPSAPSAVRTSEDLGWLACSPQEESQRFALPGPYPLEGFLNAVAVAFPWAPGPVAC